mgnify:CR=1 FL=1
MSPHATPAPLGVRRADGGGELRVWSANATALELCLFDATDRDWVTSTVPMVRDADGVWSATSPELTTGTYYSVRATGPSGPRHAFDAGRDLISRHPEVGAVILECTNMVPFARLLSEALALPVYSIYSFVCWFHAGLAPRDFGHPGSAPRDWRER